MTRPRLNLGPHLLPGAAAVALFLVMAAVIVTAPFDDPAGFPTDASIVASIGYAMFDLEGAIPSESFLVAFEIVDFLLVAALVGAVMLARREQGGSNVSLLSDGGRAIRRTFGDGDDAATDADGTDGAGADAAADDGRTDDGRAADATDADAPDDAGGDR